MALTHAMTGALAGLATAPLVAGATGDGPTAALWVVGCAGSALLPDLDQRAGTASGMWGFISRGAAETIGRVARGHRGATHDAVIAPLGGAAIFAAASATAPTRWLATAVLAGLCLAVIRVLLRPVPWLVTWVLGRTRRMVLILWLTGGRGFGWAGAIINLGLSAIIATAVVQSASGPWWFAAGAVAVGALAHIAGDALSRDGVPIPIVWLLAQTGGVDRSRFRFRLTPFKTNSGFEHWVVVPAHVAAIAGLVRWYIG
jgi:LexA-binding, inner membrane-associated putative hydrolase